MKFSMNDMLYAFSYALDCVARELVGVSTYHSQRVAYLSVLMGKQLGFQKEELADLAAYGALHDNAMSEYIQEEFRKGTDVLREKEAIDSSGHCIAGEKNVIGMPFNKIVKGTILFHHENADGSGPFGKKADEVPVFAKLIHIADQIDTVFDLGSPSQKKYEKIVEYIKSQKDILFSKECIEAFLQGVDYDKIKVMKAGNTGDLLRKQLLPCTKEYTVEEIEKIADLFASITDYKSSFTSEHSKGIAKKARTMAQFYGFDEEKSTKLYFAGAVHDLGKLVIHNDILEKPDQLTDAEFVQMKNHAYFTYEMLSKIRGLEDVTRWASLHHEKLNGTGYPFGYRAEQLGFEERLMACLDIYQALTEVRPYKKGMSHEKTMEIMQKMAADYYIDAAITNDIHTVFSG